MEATELGALDGAREERVPLRSSIVELRGADGSILAGDDPLLGRLANPIVAHDVYGELARLLAMGDDEVESPEAAYLCAAASAWAPASSASLLRALQHLGLGSKGRCSVVAVRNPALDLDVEVMCVVNPRDDVGLVVLRGPEVPVGLRWLRQPVALAPMPDGRGYVHARFLEVLSPLWDGLTELTRSREMSGRRLLFTGYGFGGVLALLASARLVATRQLSSADRRRPSLQGIHTFGQPRVGDAAFATWAEERVGERHYRYVADADLLCDLPWPWFGLHHAGRECRLQSGRWRFVRTGPAGNMAALGRLGRYTLRAVTERLGSDRNRHPGHDSHCGIAKYLRVSRQAVNRALLFP